MNGKQKTSSTTTSALTDWSKGIYNDLSGQVKSQLGQGYTPYGGQLSAGASPWQTQGAQAAQAAAGYKPQTVTAKSFLDTDLTGYMDKGLEDNIQRTLAGIERTRQVQRVGDSQQATAHGAWGGARHGVADRLTNEAAIRASGDAEAGLRSQAWRDAAGLAQQDLNRDLQTQQFNAGQGLQGAQLGLAGGGLMAQIGAQLREGEQAGLDRQYGEFNRGYEDPFRRSQGLLALMGATPWQTTQQTGTVTKTGTPWLQIAGSLAQLGGSMAGGK